RDRDGASGISVSTKSARHQGHRGRRRDFAAGGDRQRRRGCASSVRRTGHARAAWPVRCAEPHRQGAREDWRRRRPDVKPVAFDYVLAETAQRATEILAQHGDDAKVLAGGQSLVPMLNMRLSRPRVVVDLNGAAELDYLRASNGVLAVGALARQRRLERWAME